MKAYFDIFVTRCYAFRNCENFHSRVCIVIFMKAYFVLQRGEVSRIVFHVYIVVTFSSNKTSQDRDKDYGLRYHCINGAKPYPPLKAVDMV